jgi:hypothetical protein
MPPSRLNTEDIRSRKPASVAPERLSLPDLPVWLDAAQAVGLLAFGRLLLEEDTYPEPEFGESRDWGANRSLLLEALRSRGEGRPWKPRSKPMWGAWKIRAHVRRLMRDTGISAPELASELESDLKRGEANCAKIQEARQQLCAAVRDKQVEARGRRGSELHSTFTSDHEGVPSAYFLNRLHTITIDGWATIDSGVSSDAYRDRCRHRNQDWGDLRFVSVDVEALLRGQLPQAQAPARESSRPASNSLATLDGPLVEKMHELIQTGQARNPWDAALTLCGEAAGGGEPQSKAKRLSKRYSERFSAEPSGKD